MADELNLDELEQRLLRRRREQPTLDPYWLRIVVLCRELESLIVTARAAHELRRERDELRAALVNYAEEIRRVGDDRDIEVLCEIAELMALAAGLAAEKQK